MKNNKNVKKTLEAGALTKRHSEGIRPKNPLHILKRFFAKYNFPFAGNYVKPAQNDGKILAPLTQDPTPKSKISTLSHTARSFTRLASSSVQLVPQGAGIKLPSSCCARGEGHNNVKHLADFGKCAVRVAQQRAQHVPVKNLLKRSNSDSGYEVKCKGFEPPTIQDFTYSLINLFTPKKQAAFTLAEVLITLGVIGVVAAMTIPGLITKYHRQVVETKLAKFDSLINQALRMSVAESEGLVYSPPDGKDNAEYLKSWLNEYLLKYMKSDYDGDVINDMHYKVKFHDGTGFVVYINPDSHTIHFFFCTEANDKSCTSESFDGQKTFVFNYVPNAEAILPYGNDITDIQKLKYNTATYAAGCYTTFQPKQRHLCGQLIKLNGWKIPKDYPWIK